MSEEQNQETTQLVNNELTERVNNAYIANGYSMLDGGIESFVMISGDKDEKKADMLLTLSGICEMADELRAKAEKKNETNEEGK